MLNKKELISKLITEYITEIPMIINKKTSKKDIKYEHRNEYDVIKRKIDNYIDKNEVHKRFIVLPGIRQVRKTTILY